MKTYLALAAITLGALGSVQATLVVKSEGTLGSGTTSVGAGETLVVQGNQTIGGLNIGGGGTVVLGKGSTTSTSAIPEPTSALFGLGLLAALTLRRRR